MSSHAPTGMRERNSTDGSFRCGSVMSLLCVCGTIWRCEGGKQGTIELPGVRNA